MTTTYENSSKNITTLLNGTIQSIQQTIPIPVQMGKPSADTKELHTQFGSVNRHYRPRKRPTAIFR